MSDASSAPAAKPPVDMVNVQINGTWHQFPKGTRMIEACKQVKAEVPHYWLVDPRDQTLAVYRWQKDGYLQTLAAVRGDRVRAEPFTAIELPVGVLFGDDDE